MCGIAGVARIDGADLDPAADSLLDRMATLLAHRGPDDRELLRSGPVGLAFNRLSLVDPTNGGQPLVSDDGDLVLIANGEVYNHRELAAGLPGVRLRTGSDCEVLLYLYRERGLAFLDQVCGMFALVLWDKRRGELVFARDRFGIKPLYYHRDARRIVFGSEIKALFADEATPRQLDWDKALTTPLLPAAPYLTDDPLTTWFVGVEAVPAGRIQRIDLTTGATCDHQYWEFPGAVEADPRTAEEYVSRYRALLTDSVRACATADAELGLFLSGGIDSAAVAALAAPVTGELHTFTVLSASTYRTGDPEHSHRVAAKLGLPNHQLLFDAARTPSAAEWKRLLWLMETPMCGPEAYYKHELHRFAKSVRPGIRGMLLGAASDEFNGGYTTSAGEADWPEFERNMRAMARTSALRARPDAAAWWQYGDQALLTDEALRYLTDVATADPYPAYLRWQHRKLQQYNVWHEDRAAAGSGIEARVPFLDHRLVELAASVPPALRPTLLWDKAILREGLRGVLPHEVVERPKMPFFYGTDVRHTFQMVLRLLAQHGGALVEEALAAPGADTYLDGPALRSTLARLADDPRSAQVEVALRVVNLGLLASMAADLPAPTVHVPGGPLPAALPAAHAAMFGSDDLRRRATDLERALGLRPPIEEGTLRLADHVLLLDEPRSATSYLVANGSIEYELDEPELVAVLRASDGTRTLRTVLAELGRGVDDVYEQLRDLIDDGLVVLG
ncbi:MAG: asparagine synthase (glutamine-hydrolyzing) [Micromonosporaceae bacterium]